MRKNLERWTADCTFARLARLHNGRPVAFATAKVWEVIPNLPKVHIRYEGLQIGTVDIEKGTYEAENDSPMYGTMIRNLANRINEGAQYATAKAYMAGIEGLYIDDAKKASDRLQEVHEALYGPAKVYNV